MPPRRRGLSETDRAVWAAYARMVAPLPGRPADSVEVQRPVLEEAAPRAQRSIDILASPRQYSQRPPAAQLEVGGQPGGLDRATWQRLRAGKLVTQRTLDLHGMTVQNAYQALISFLRGAHAQ